MRIGINCYQLARDMGGLRQYLATLLRGLLGAGNGHTCTLFAFEHNLPVLEEMDLPDWRKNARLLTRQREIRAFWRDLDLYFCPFSILWPRPVPLPSVVTIPDVQERFLPQFFTARQLWIRRWHFETSARQADMVITLSEFSRRTIIDSYGTEERRVKVIHLSTDPAVVSTDVPSRASLPALPDDFIYYPANRWEHKNHDALLAALAILKKERGTVIPLVVTGHDYPGGYDLPERIRHFGLEGQVIDLGYLPHRETGYLYRRARLLCFPSLFEGFGLPVLEAMACGCPVACSRATSLPEIGGDAAVYFDPSDPAQIAGAVFRLWSDDALRAGMVAAGRERARLFSTERMIRGHWESFHEAREHFSRPRYLRNLLLREPPAKVALALGRMGFRW